MGALFPQSGLPLRIGPFRYKCGGCHQVPRIDKATDQIRSIPILIFSPRVETFFACTEADFENRPCARENCAKLVRRAFPTGPRKFVRKMCGGIRKCAEIVRDLCGGALAQFAPNIGVGLPRMCVHKFRAIFC